MRKIKKFILIQNILKIRKEAIKKIINNIRHFIKYKRDYNKNITKTQKLIKKIKDCYSISPTYNNMTKMSIKIYNDPKNTKKFEIYPLNFCPIRKRFVLDIPKKKFILKSNKTLRFNFIANDEIIVDNSFFSCNINNIFVNEINFIDIDNKIKKLNETIYNFKKKLNMKKKYLKPIKILKLNEDSDETLNKTNDENDEFDSDNSSNEEIFSLNNSKTMTPNIKLLKSYSKKNTNSPLFFNNFSDTLSPNQHYKSKIKSSTELFNFPCKSILKSRSNRNSFKTTKCRRKVSFGSVEFAY